MKIQNEYMKNQSFPHQALLESCHHHLHHLQKVLNIYQQEIILKEIYIYIIIELL